MPALALLMLASAAAASPRTERGSAPANLLTGPARCVLRYLEAVRNAGPHTYATIPRRTPAPLEQDYARAKALTAPRTLAEVELSSARGEDHPLAPWRAAARSGVLEAFQLLAVRRAPRGAAVVTVAEHWSRAGGGPLEATVSEYLVARVAGEWKVVDRRPGAAFDDDVIEIGYAGYFDEPVRSR